MERPTHPTKALRIASRSKCIDGIVQQPSIVELSFSDIELNVQITNNHSYSLNYHPYSAGNSFSIFEVFFSCTCKLRELWQFSCSACRKMGIKNWPYRMVGLFTNVIFKFIICVNLYCRHEIFDLWSRHGLWRIAGHVKAETCQPESTAWQEWTAGKGDSEAFSIKYT